MSSVPTIYVRFAVVNFIVLTVLGLALRYIHISSLGPVNYQFLLHSHSHFAFAGWMFFAIALLIINLIGQDARSRAFKWVMILTLVSAYGMLVSFYLQGYKAVSITFSTLFIIATYRFTWLVFKYKALTDKLNELSSRLIKASLVFLCLSSIGPFALGPLMAAGLKNTAVYQDAIYFYLHFQLNGFMLLAVWGLFASVLPVGSLSKTARIWLHLFIYSTALLYFIFTLWSKPTPIIQILAAAGAITNLVSWLALCFAFRNSLSSCSALTRAALIATSLKVLFQAPICYSPIGAWAFSNRDLIIGYIHLLTLGIITPLILDQMMRHGFVKRWAAAVWVYIVASIIYLAALFMQTLLTQFAIQIPAYQVWLFVISVIFLLVAIAFFLKISAER